MVPDRRTTRFNICHVSVNEHAATYDRITVQLRAAIADLGYPCDLNVNRCIGGAVNIVVGQIVLAWPYRGHVVPSILDRSFVLYQFAQLLPDHELLREVPTYVESFAQAAAIWEHAPSGMAYFEASPWSDKARYLPPAFHAALESFRPDPDPQIDVLVYGAPSPRRGRLLDKLGERGLKVVFMFGAYGEPLHAEIRKARIVLNLHKLEGDILETVRLSHLLANRCFVVSETGDHNPFGDGVVYATYDDLADTCAAYLGPRAAEREAVAAAGYAAVRRWDMTANVRDLIAQLPIDTLTSDP